MGSSFFVGGLGVGRGKGCSKLLAKGWVGVGFEDVES